MGAGTSKQRERETETDRGPERPRPAAVTGRLEGGCGHRAGRDKAPLRKRGHPAGHCDHGAWHWGLAPSKRVQGETGGAIPPTGQEHWRVAQTTGLERGRPLQAGWATVSHQGHSVAVATAIGPRVTSGKAPTGVGDVSWSYSWRTLRCLRER